MLPKFELMNCQAIAYASENDLPEHLKYRLELSRESYQSSNPYEIGGQRCSVSALNLLQMRKFAKFFEETLGYPVNLEFVVADGGLYPVQLRPVPTLQENREVTSLGPLPEGQHLVAETPFVIGSFRAKARLVLAHDKNYYGGHKFKEPVVIWHDDVYKGHRFYFTDDNCLALLNIDEGAALTHSHSLLPEFGPSRDKFRFIGLPNKGLADKLLRCMRDVQEVVHEGAQGDKRFGWFSYTPFELTVESDGRRGRVYVSKEHAGYFR